MSKTQIIHCPNCGDLATKQITEHGIQRTACRNCDYLLVQCAKTARVIEAYAPGFNSYYVVNSAPA